MYPIQWYRSDFFFRWFHLRHNRQLFRAYSPRWVFCVYLSVQEQVEANSVFKRLSACALCAQNSLNWALDPTLKRSEMTEHLRRDDDNRSEDLRGSQSSANHHFDLTKFWISTWRQPLQPWPSVESRTHRWAPETDLQWGPRHLDIHREKTTGTSGPLTLWLCCSWNKLLIRLELPPRLSLVSPKVFSPFCHRWSFCSSGLLSWGHFIYSNIIDLIAQILFKLNWAGQCHY